MYDGVPHRRVNRSPGAMIPAKPKSVALRGDPGSSRSNRKLSGLMSRKMMPRLWHCAAVRRTERTSSAASASVYDRPLLMPLSSSPPSHRSISRCTASLSSNESYRYTTDKLEPILRITSSSFLSLL